MFVYSKRIIQFVREISSVINDVLSREVGLRVSRNRFYDRRQECSYPITIVVYNDKSMLGFFDPEFYELGFHERLMHISRQELHRVIRHELAHYITFINHGAGVPAHGAEFKAFCERMHWGEEISRATTCLAEAESAATKEESAILRKVQKLMALSTSSNQNEAELAMIKAQQLLLKHNIDSKYIESDNDEKIILKRLIKQKKKDAKMHCIARILETFFVSIVYKRQGEYTYLEILGDAVNVEIAAYVADFLHVELDTLWNHAARHANVRGLIAKNSFFHGLSKGYCNKIKALKNEHNQETATALIRIEKQLIEQQAMVYGRLSSSMSRRQHCGESSALGEQMGRRLTINPAVRHSGKDSGCLLVHS